MKHGLLYIISAFFLLINNAVSQVKSEIVIGQKNYIKSEILSEEREYWISYPNSYHTDNLSYKKYPILLLLDANSHFELVSAMTKFMSSGNSDKMEIPEMIVVGVLNVNRERDFTPDKIITKRDNQTGGGDNFLEFLSKELIPKIESEHRTVPYRILIGHSLGGLITTHSYLKDNSTFNSFISIDPSFGNWDEKTMDIKIANANKDVVNRPFYLATANWDKRNLRNRDRHIRFYESLKAKSENNFNAVQKYYIDKNHSSIPLPAIYDGLLSIFNGYSQPYRNISDVDELIKIYEDLSNRHAFSFLPPEELVNRIGYHFSRSSNLDDKQLALKFFQLNAKNYPESFNVFDSLGEMHYELGNENEAIENFQKSITLNPENENAIKFINRIENTSSNKH